MIQKGKFHHKDTKNTKVRIGGVKFGMNEFQGLNHGPFFRKRSYDRTKNEFNTN